ncbi:UNKNOWN [Stylonychia lemnae]|uniref:Uncharacterized protein n=1 Tax=Stylonychia lemnae TaxID=5949 RepID=A0A078AXT0_STYLE|nr:UNKNOWN [Stylonychia lemnae]|eukprot:CDW86979.1 UNKNOWN [Stylonychia lemnae]
MKQEATQGFLKYKFHKSQLAYQNMNGMNIPNLPPNVYHFTNQKFKHHNTHFFIHNQNQQFLEYQKNQVSGQGLIQPFLQQQQQFQQQSNLVSINNLAFSYPAKNIDTSNISIIHQNKIDSSQVIKEFTSNQTNINNQDQLQNAKDFQKYLSQQNYKLPLTGQSRENNGFNDEQSQKSLAQHIIEMAQLDYDDPQLFEPSVDFQRSQIAQPSPVAKRKIKSRQNLNIVSNGSQNNPNGGHRVRLKQNTNALKPDQAQRIVYHQYGQNIQARQNGNEININNNSLLNNMNGTQNNQNMQQTIQGSAQTEIFQLPRIVDNNNYQPPVSVITNGLNQVMSETIDNSKIQSEEKIKSLLHSSLNSKVNSLALGQSYKNAPQTIKKVQHPKLIQARSNIFMSNQAQNSNHPMLQKNAQGHKRKLFQIKEYNTNATKAESNNMVAAAEAMKQRKTFYDFNSHQNNSLIASSNGNINGNVLSQQFQSNTLTNTFGQKFENQSKLPLSIPQKNDKKDEELYQQTLNESLYRSSGKQNNNPGSFALPVKLNQRNKNYDIEFQESDNKDPDIIDTYKNGKIANSELLHNQKFSKSQVKNENLDNKMPKTFYLVEQKNHQQNLLIDGQSSPFNKIYPTQGNLEPLAKIKLSSLNYLDKQSQEQIILTVRAALNSDMSILPQTFGVQGQNFNNTASQQNFNVKNQATINNPTNTLKLSIIQQIIKAVENKDNKISIKRINSGMVQRTEDPSQQHSPSIQPQALNSSNKYSKTSSRKVSIKDIINGDMDFKEVSKDRRASDHSYNHTYQHHTHTHHHHNNAGSLNINQNNIEEERNRISSILNSQNASKNDLKSINKKPK